MIHGRFPLLFPLLMVLAAAAGSAAAQDAPLFFREDWKEIPLALPVTQEHVANPRLAMELHGAGREGVKKSNHPEIPNDPYYIWMGNCTANCAISLRHTEAFADLTTPGARVRWRSKQSGFRELRLIVRLADGTWLVSDASDAASDGWEARGKRLSDLPWREHEFRIAAIRWRKLDIDTVLEGAWVEKPDLGRVDALGWTDLRPGNGTPSSSRVDWMEVYARAVKR